jgi:class 3 adenylate cyclase
LRITVDLVRELGFRVIDRQELKRGALTLIENHPDDVTMMITDGVHAGHEWTQTRPRGLA